MLFSGYKSWRLPNEGSWFVREVVKVFMEHAHREHLADLLTKVSSVVTGLALYFCVSMLVNNE